MCFMYIQSNINFTWNNNNNIILMIIISNDDHLNDNSLDFFFIYIKDSIGNNQMRNQDKLIY